MEQLPLYISICFMLITILSVALFCRAARHSKTTLIVLSAWLLLQAAIALTGFYTHSESTPPRLAFALLPPLVLIAFLFATPRGRQYIDGLDIKALTIFHTVRIFVELTLAALFIHKYIPGIMTFEGRNFDILSGITAPIIFYICFIRQQQSKWLLIGWNVLCFILLLNIVTIALLSAPTPFQHFGFGQPNIAIFYFPFVWLPACIVPMALFAHLAAIRQIVRRK